MLLPIEEIWLRTWNPSGIVSARPKQIPRRRTPPRLAWRSPVVLAFRVPKVLSCPVAVRFSAGHHTSRIWSLLALGMARIRWDMPKTVGDSKVMASDPDLLTSDLLPTWVHRESAIDMLETLKTSYWKVAIARFFTSQWPPTTIYQSITLWPSGPPTKHLRLKIGEQTMNTYV